MCSLSLAMGRLLSREDSGPKPSSLLPVVGAFLHHGPLVSGRRRLRGQRPPTRGSPAAAQSRIAPSPHSRRRCRTLLWLLAGSTTKALLRELASILDYPCSRSSRTS